MSGPGVSVDEWAFSRGLLGVSELVHSMVTCGTIGVQFSTLAKCFFAAVTVGKEPKKRKFVILG